MSKQKKESIIFIFFPGKGIVSLPGFNVVIEVTSSDKAKNILYLYSLLVTGTSLPKNCDKEDLLSAEKLFGLTKDDLKEQSDNIIKTNIDKFEFINATNSETRTHINSKRIEWENISTSLKENGFVLKKRPILNSELDECCPVYVVENSEIGVISEGKGLVEEQAKRSALAEAVERTVGNSPQEFDHIIVDSCDNLYKDKEWKLNIQTGPRDMYFDKIITEWIPAYNILRKDNCYLPAELAYFNYGPNFTKTELFTLHHTMGLSVGTSLEEATINGIFEILERDAYWIVMRCRINCPDIDLKEINKIDEKVLDIINILDKNGFDLHLKDMSLDWGVPIAHAVLVDRNKGIPAFSHGVGAGFDWVTAVARAVTEVVQMYSGICEFTKDEDVLQRILRSSSVLGNPGLAWSDPLFEPHIKHLIEESNTQWKSEQKLITVEEFLKKIESKGYEIIVSKLGELSGLQVVRVYIPEATQPDERLERMSDRLEQFRKKENLGRGFYSDPILT